MNTLRESDGFPPKYPTVKDAEVPVLVSNQGRLLVSQKPAGFGTLNVMCADSYVKLPYKEGSEVRLSNNTGKEIAVVNTWDKTILGDFDSDTFSDGQSIDGVDGWSGQGTITPDNNDETRAPVLDVLQGRRSVYLDGSIYKNGVVVVKDIVSSTRSVSMVVNGVTLSIEVDNSVANSASINSVSIDYVDSVGTDADNAWFIDNTTLRFYAVEDSGSYLSINTLTTANVYTGTQLSPVLNTKNVTVTVTDGSGTTLLTPPDPAESIASPLDEPAVVGQSSDVYDGSKISSLFRPRSKSKQTGLALFDGSNNMVLGIYTNNGVFGVSTDVDTNSSIIVSSDIIRLELVWAPSTGFYKAYAYQGNGRQEIGSGYYDAIKNDALSYDSFKVGASGNGCIVDRVEFHTLNKDSVEFEIMQSPSSTVFNVLNGTDEIMLKSLGSSAREYSDANETVFISGFYAQS